MSITTFNTDEVQNQLRTACNLEGQDGKSNSYDATIVGTDPDTDLALIKIEPKTALPVLGVPVQSKALNGMDSLLSIVQMPAGIPVATFAIGNAGAANAALFAAAMLAHEVPAVGAALVAFRTKQTSDVIAHDDPRT